ncbi:hypothetical protein HDU82_005127 [Entophlyctis luteolus]|nr:hypothetical protein HDU82_005127 [Entophlyctis luteolus]
MTVVEVSRETLDAEDILLLFLASYDARTARGAPLSSKAKRQALELFSNKLPGTDAAVIKSIVSEQLIPLLEQADRAFEWYFDGLVGPMKDLLSPSVSWSGSSDAAVLLRLLDLLYDRIDASRQVSFDWMTSNHRRIFGNTLFSLLSNAALKSGVAASGSRSSVEKWIPLAKHFPIEGALRTLLLAIGVEEAHSLDLSFPQNLFADETNLIPIVSCLDENAHPQFRRKALSSTLLIMRKSKNSSSSKRDHQAGAEAEKSFVDVALDLVKLKDFAEFADLFTQILQTSSLAAFGDSLPDLVIATSENIQNGDLSMIETNSAFFITTLMHIGKNNGSRSFDVADAVFDIIDKVDSGTAGQLSGSLHFLGPNAKKAALKHLDKIVALTLKGDQSGNALMATLLTAENADYFRSYIGDFLTASDPMIALRVLGAFFQQTDLFATHMADLLALLQNKMAGATASTIIVNVVKADPTVYSTPEKLMPIVNAFKSPTSTSMVLGPYKLGLFQIYGAVAGASLEGSKLCTPLIISELSSILAETGPRDPNTGTVLSILLQPLSTVAKEYPGVLNQYEPVLDRLQSDPAGKVSPARDVLENVMNALHGVSLQSLAGKLSASMKSLGINPDDPFFDAVEESLKKEGVKEYDCMLSYKSVMQSTVIRIRDSLVARGFTVWLDLEQMSGNVYGKMADAVLGSKVIIPCLSSSYETSGNCKRELGFAADQTRNGKKIVPVRLDDGPFTWTALITSGLLYTYIGSHELTDLATWEGAMNGLAHEVSIIVGPRGEKAAQAASDAEFRKAVEKSMENEEREEYDCMLSYKLSSISKFFSDIIRSWSQQKAVMTIHDALVKRGLSVWIDLEEMSGNVYGRMADGVLGSKVVVPCISSTYESSGNCKRELEFAYEQVPNGKRILPITFDKGPFTWTQEIISKASETIAIDLAELEVPKKLNELMDELAMCISREVERASSRVYKNEVVEKVESGVASSDQFSLLEKRVAELEDTVTRQRELLDQQSAMLQRIYKFLDIKFESLE